MSLDEWAQVFSAFSYNGLMYPFIPFQQTAPGQREEVGAGFVGFVQSAYRSNGVVFSVMLVRMLLFSEARFMFQDMTEGRPGKLFSPPGHSDLDLLAHPWTNAATGDLLTRAIQDVDLAGNFFTLRHVNKDTGNLELRRLRPDWVTIVAGSTSDADVQGYDLDSRLLGYVYAPGGAGMPGDPNFILPEQICHFAPVPDPFFNFRGMPWLEPILREVMADGGFTCQPLDAKVLTPLGWTTMGEVKLGDRVIGADGKPRKVLGVHPQGERDVYRVTFSNGGSTECDETHIWEVQTRWEREGGTRPQPLLMTTRQMLDSGGPRLPNSEFKWSVRYPDPVEFESEESLPVDPYLLGVLLGDGCTLNHQISVCSHQQDALEMEEALTATVPEGVRVVKYAHRTGTWSSFSLSGRQGTTNPLMLQLKELGLAGVIGYEKSIPESYLRASIDDRVALLQGLLDTDGHVDSINVEFSTTSHQLCVGLQDLVRGLGGRASIYSVLEEGRRPAWVVRVSKLPYWIIPVRLVRKVKLYHPGRSHKRRAYITSIERVGRKPVQCISVDSGDGLYLTDDYIVTHNSHKLKYLEHGATPNMVITLDPQIGKDMFNQWIEKFEAKHVGLLNAYRTLYLGGGASAAVVGNNLKDMDYKLVQGAGETRIAAAAGVPPVIAGLSEGLAAATYSNYQQSMRRLGDGTMRPLWRNLSSSLESIINLPPKSRLWYDDRDIPWLREDVKDKAAAQLSQSQVVATLIEAGFKPESVISAVAGDDLTLLEHTGLYSMKLQAPGEMGEPGGPTPGVAPPPVQLPAKPKPPKTGEEFTPPSSTTPATPPAAPTGNGSKPPVPAGSSEGQ
jgi:hypothetical protein